MKRPGYQFLLPMFPTVSPSFPRFPKVPDSHVSLWSTGFPKVRCLSPLPRFAQVLPKFPQSSISILTSTQVSSPLCKFLQCSLSLLKFSDLLIYRIFPVFLKFYKSVQVSRGHQFLRSPHVSLRHISISQASPLASVSFPEFPRFPTAFFSFFQVPHVSFIFPSIQNFPVFTSASQVSQCSPDSLFSLNFTQLFPSF